MALAVHVYASTHNSRMPWHSRPPYEWGGSREPLPGSTSTQGVPNWEIFSWRSAILPQLEQQAVFDRIDPHKPSLLPPNLDVARMRLEIFECPSTPGAPRRINSNYRLDDYPLKLDQLDVAAADYACASSMWINREGIGSTPYSHITCAWFMYSDGDLHLDPNQASKFVNGIRFGTQLDSPVIQPSWDNITDGLTATIMLRELAGRPEAGRVEANWDPGHRRHWEGPWIAHESGYMHVQDPPGRHPTSSRGFINPENLHQNQHPLSIGVGYHPSGCNFAFCDGRVQFMSKSTPLPPLVAMLTHNAGDVAP